ncbi:MAG TPA: transporter [Rhodospirillaceae bacterium]|nr:transporter [Rhodospirillaceae bacterium]
MSVSTLRKTMVSWIGLMAVCSVATEANAAGFALREQSAEGLGSAFAGGAANAGDASTAFYNPAGLSRLTSNQVSSSVTWISPVAKFTGTNSSPLGGNVTGSQAENGIKAAAIGAVYGVWNASPDWKMALAVNAPFGLRSDYKPDWIGRYQALASELTDIDVSVLASYRFNEHFSIGGGPRVAYIKARLSNAINFQAIGLGTAQQLAAGARQAGAGAAAAAAAGQLSTASALQAQATSLATQAAGLQTLASGWGDGLGKIEGDDVTAGYTFGGLYEIDKQTRLGLSYRSRMSNTLSGTASYQTPATLGLAGPTLSGLFAGQGATAKITMPDSFNLGFHRDISDQWAVMASLEWTHWSLFKTLSVVGANGQAISSTNENWQDTWAASLGTNYRIDEKWQVRGGVAYDQSPVRDAFRTPRVPDSDRTWVTFGGTYAVTPAADVTFGYGHIFGASAPVTSTNNSASGTLTGSYDNSVDIFSVSASLRF